MEKMKVEALVPERKEGDKIVQAKVGPYIIEVNTGATAAEMIQMFGDKAVKSNAEDAWIVKLQANMRTGMKKGETQAALQARLGGAKMGETTRGVPVDPKAAVLNMLASAKPDEKRQILTDLGFDKATIDRIMGAK
jgi:hypothetical protein